MATLFAVDIKLRGWQIDGVVTFGSPRVGQQAFKSLYQELNLHHLTVRFANRSDFVPCVPLSDWGFEHVVENFALGFRANTVNSHSIRGNSESYHHTLQDAMEGRHSKLQHGFAAHALTFATASKSRESNMQELKVDVALLRRDIATMAGSSVELKVDVASLRQDIAKWAEGMLASVQALMTCIRQAQLNSVEQIRQNFERQQQLGWLLDMETLLEIVKHYKSQLQTWQQGVPEWFFRYKVQLSRALEAAKMELRDPNSQLAHQFVVLYLRAAHLLIAAMRNSAARLRDLDKEFQKFVAAAKRAGVAKCLRFEIPLLNEILQLLPSKEDFTLPQEVDVKLGGPISNDRILQMHGRSGRSLQVGCRLLGLLKWSGQEAPKLKFDSEEPMNAMSWQLTSNTPDSQTSSTLEFEGWEPQTDASVQQLASEMPQNLTSLSLGFSWCKQITDASVQQLASKMPQNLTSMSLDFSRVQANHRCICAAACQQDAAEPDFSELGFQISASKSQTHLCSSLPARCRRT